MSNTNEKDKGGSVPNPQTEVEILREELAKLRKEIGESKSKSESEKLDKLLNIQLAKEVRELKKEELQEIQQKARDDQRRKNSQNHQETIIRKQTACTHRKGGKITENTPQGDRIDYNVFMHTFIMGPQTSMIKCMTCKAKWFRDDTTEYLLRNGRKIRNHTKIGWAEAVQLVQRSSNKSSSSETVFGPPPVESVARELDGSEAANVQL